MNKINRILVLTTFFAVLLMGNVSAEKFVGKANVPAGRAKSAKSEASCLPASNSNELTINNVRAYIETNGTMWSREIAEYEIPRGSGKTSMFAAALWIGGYDVTGQLKLAAVRFRQIGDDYWTGPLDVGTASVSQGTCRDYDKLFKITRSEVVEHISRQNVDPSYSMPASIRDWPGNGSGNQSPFLAPYMDVDGNDEYNPEGGDYPYYDLDNALCPWTPENIALAAADQLPWTPERKWWKNKAPTLGVPAEYHDNKMIYADHVLKGDETLFWIFNDKGNVHSESGGLPIGLEIRGQAFAFATNDEINNMTFYSYEIINRSSTTLKDTYFSQWVDADLGFAQDDYVGCDVIRGLGYCYNGKDVDGQGNPQEYGSQPPAVGVDFFQGPYIDPDGYDNPAFSPDSAYMGGTVADEYCERYMGLGIDGRENDQMGINGVNFGDSIVDNERFGMRRFVYHNNDNSVIGDPSTAVEYYRMLTGLWKDGQKMRYGKNAHPNTGAVGPECDFMFPGTTDPCNWGTQGITPTDANYEETPWTEMQAGNTYGDRRFMQSAGPFSLQSGAVNYITVGIPWARASQGGAYASVELLKIADDKCQSLFENCFKVLDGPDAPDVYIRELDNKLVLYITNDDPKSNNENESYEEIDNSIAESTIKETLVIVTDSIVTADTVYHFETSQIVREEIEYDRKYRFEGYQIYQLKHADVSIAEIDDNSVARLVGQCDIINNREDGSPVGQLVNWTFDEALGTSVPTEMVNGTNTGVYHSLEITEDQFASGVKSLVNYKDYHYLVMAYAYNEFAAFSIDPNIEGGLMGQSRPYLAGRKLANGNSIPVHTASPHPVSSQNVGTVLNADYGTQPMITRLEGQGNGGFALELTDETKAKILDPSNGWKCNDLQYKRNAGPINVKVIDPLRLQPFDYIVELYNLPDTVEGTTETVVNPEVNKDTRWRLKFADNVTDEQIRSIVDEDSVPVYVDLNNNVIRSFDGGSPISEINERLFIPLGISVAVQNVDFKIYDEDLAAYYAEGNEGGLNYRNVTTFGQVDMISSEMVTEDGVTPWLNTFHDEDGDYPSNWIRSGKQNDGNWDFGDADNQVQKVYSRWKKEDFFYPLTLSNARKYITYLGSSGQTVRAWRDPSSQFENSLSWAPYQLTSPYDGGPQAWITQPDSTTFQGIVARPYRTYYDFTTIIQPDTITNLDFYRTNPGHNPTLTNVYSVDVVYTPDQSLWTRCVVLESCDDPTQSIGGALRHEPRKSLSVGKDGLPDGSTDGFGADGTEGLGWFPGYAINIETGERLNIMFAENSSLPKDNGSDMIFNPTQTYAYMKTTVEETGADTTVSIGQADFEYLWDVARAMGDYSEAPTLSLGGMHYVYVMNSSGNTSSSYLDDARDALFQTRSYNGAGYVSPNYPMSSNNGLTGSVKNGGTLPTGGNWFDCGVYDEAAWLKEKFKAFVSLDVNQYQRTLHKMQLFNNVMWTNIPTQTFLQDENWGTSEITVKLRVTRPYLRYSSRWFNDPAEAPAEQVANNQGMPRYSFTTEDIAPDFKQAEIIGEQVLQDINIVPNPYYGFSTYESTALENYVKITNLPEKCDISIYTVNGTLIRTFNKIDAGTTFIQWDLKNQANIPIGGGVYIIYVDAPGIGNRTLKFFCAMRPTDLNSF